MNTWEIEPAHVLHVAQLAVKLAHFWRAYQPVAPDEISILEAAALLHDIGWAQTADRDGKGHHKISERMILEANWDHDLAPYVPVVAAVARYHRKRGPKDTDLAYSQLSPQSKQTVYRMASLLRLADALDRMHQQIWDIINLEPVSSHSVCVWVQARQKTSIREVESAWQKKSDLAREVWNCDWVLRQV
ncbi:MAG: HD domain-containing protein [Methylacidiphilales bacterium]|nr:HD domain-containing protein [Candidatus Methylacidiphilales bacterium]MDW8349914.1 HD domain-containing protein [Verrucomicrobiae bacterium]